MHRQIHRTAVLTSAFLAFGAGALSAQKTLDTTVAVRSGARLSVQNPNGSVVVRSWNRSQVRVVAESGDSPVLEVTAGQILVRSEVHRRRGRGDAEFSITVPTGTPVQIGGMSVDVDVSDVCGDVQINTLSGDVNVRCAADVQVTAISGDIALADVRGRVDVSATNGDITVRGVRGGVSARAVSGDIDLSQIDGDNVEAEAVSGDVSYTGRVADSGRYRLVTHSGDVSLRVVGTLNAAIEVETFSGEMLSDFPIQIAPGTTLNRSMSFRLGTGSARVRLSSFSGTISLRRATGASREE